ncbi:CaiB/BaiF CoA transferase family protein [Nocardioides sp. Soil796]|uniref:CaiB/BaiF CoA transferase family protein n=1 Tax=Nocardioides sp. Soil796 TaxID=1736412 RepID=UPI00070B347C|nr:CoA transferase [Nocardioides sp. Soil796]KRF10376.1 carnitine dehydratase [Nocardioides sp. Soil796]
MNARPLTGVKVVDFGQFIAAPAATQVLVDLGADVIKVEPVHGESSRVIGLHGEAMLQMHNRGKRGVALDLKSDQGQEIAQRLIADADVVVQNLRPGVMEAFGLGAAQVLEAHPHMVYASISGFGLNGPGRMRAGLDIAAQAESGIMHVTGEADGEPQRVGFQMVDAAAAHVAAEAILGAYVQRLRTGKGDTVEVSLLEVAIQLQASAWGAYLISGEEPIRSGNGQPSIAPAADVMPTKDGAVVVSAYSEVHFSRLCRLLGRPELADDPRFGSNTDRVRNRPVMLAELHECFALLTSDAAMELLTSNGVVAGRINTYADVRRHADVEASGIFLDTVDEAGARTTTMASPWHLGSVTELPASAAPGLGQHTAVVLAELGYDTDTIDRLVADGVVVTGA